MNVDFAIIRDSGKFAITGEMKCFQPGGWFFSSISNTPSDSKWSIAKYYESPSCHVICENSKFDIKLDIRQSRSVEILEPIRYSFLVNSLEIADLNYMSSFVFSIGEPANDAVPFAVTGVMKKNSSNRWWYLFDPVRLWKQEDDYVRFVTGGCFNCGELHQAYVYVYVSLLINEL